MSAVRRLFARRGGLWLLLALVAAGVAAALTVQAGAGGPHGGVLVARVPLPPGTLVDAEDLAVTVVPAGLSLAGLLTDPLDAAGRRTVAPIAPGEPVTAATLGGDAGTGPAPLEPGERAVAVPLSAAGGAGAALSWGARVDVVASTGEGPAGRSEVVVADAEVLAVAVSGDGEAVDPTLAGEVLLRVGARDALRITAAVNFAREVRLLARPPGEVGPPSTTEEGLAP